MKLKYSFNDKTKNHTIDAVNDEGHRLASVSMSEYQGKTRSMHEVMAHSVQAAIKLVNELHSIEESKDNE